MSTCLNCGFTGMHADYCSAGQRAANPTPRCEGDAVICGMPDGSLLAHCGAGGNWSVYVRDDLALASEGPRLVREHDEKCRPV